MEESRIVVVERKEYSGKFTAIIILTQTGWICFGFGFGVEQLTCNLFNFNVKCEMTYVGIS